MKLTDLELLVKTLNNKLAAENSAYRLKMNNNMDVFLVDRDDESVDDDEPLTVNQPSDLIDYIDDVISAEKSNM